MKRHPSFGPVPPEEFHRAEKAGVPQCHQIIKQYVPRFGKAEQARHRWLFQRKKP